jgi:hypothetical protein
LKLPIDTSIDDLHAVTADHRSILAATPNWEVVGTVLFEGRVDFLVFVERRYFYQISNAVFRPFNIEIPSGWHMVTGVADRIRGVGLLIAHPFIASQPTLAAELVDMNPDAITTLRLVLEHNESEADEVCEELYKVVPSPERSELHKFASWFHQDWKLVFPDFRAGVEIYLKNLPMDGRRILADELRKFIEHNSTASSQELKQQWLELGAQGWQNSLDIHSTLDEFLATIAANQATGETPLGLRSDSGAG